MSLCVKEIWEPWPPKVQRNLIMQTFKQLILTFSYLSLTECRSVSFRWADGQFLSSLIHDIHLVHTTPFRCLLEPGKDQTAFCTFSLCLFSGLYYGVNLGMIPLAVLLTSLVINIRKRSDEHHPMPPWMRKVRELYCSTWYSFGLLWPIPMTLINYCRLAALRSSLGHDSSFHLIRGSRQYD